MKTELTGKLLAWYQVNQRKLPWRETRDPYAIWVAEVMLQQTRVDTVLSYYKKWMEVFPSIKVLAVADLQTVLSVWEGLGYYSRARNLHKAARRIVDDYSAEIPTNRKVLETLPGIGKAGAADILSIACGQDHASVDGNIRRVIARIFEIPFMQGSPEFETRVQSAVNKLLPPGHAGDYNQAWMDLGATICLPAEPQCQLCPISEFCDAHQHHNQSKYPIRKQKQPIPLQVLASAVILKMDHSGTAVLLCRRPAAGLLGGLWTYPGGKVQATETMEKSLQESIQSQFQVNCQIGEQLGIFKHAYTHFKVVVHAFYCRFGDDESELNQGSDTAWVDIQHLADYPMGKVDRLISDLVTNHQTAS